MAIKSDLELKNNIGSALSLEFLTDLIDSKLSILNGNSLKSGVDQATAGAAANELWIDTNDNSLKIGV